MAGSPEGFRMFAALQPGARIAGYLIEDQVGFGGMAVVFRARDEMLGRLAAIKVIAPALAANDEFRARFLRESRAAASVDEPHIIPVYAAGETQDGLLYIATRFVADGDLGALLRRNQGPLDPKRAAGLITQVASALDAAHRAGLVHRDVKPANILVNAAPGQAEHAYLSDFGLTTGMSFSTELTPTGHILGTPDYCAPEQIRSLPVDGRADQYALACVAFVLLTGVVAFQRAEMVATLFAHLNDPVPDVTGTRPELPATVNAVLAKAMAKDPKERYGSCGEFAAALQAALAPVGPAVTLGAQVSGVPGTAPGRAPGDEPSGPPAGSPQPGGGSVGGAPTTVHVPKPPVPKPPVLQPSSGGHRTIPPWPGPAPAPTGRRKTAVLAGSAAIAVAVAATVTALLLPGSARGTGTLNLQATTPASSSAGAGGQLVGTINASGSGSQTLFQVDSAVGFLGTDPRVDVHYYGSGSAEGRAELAEGNILFAGSDSPIPAAERASFRGRTVLYFPVQLGAIEIAVNLPRITRLKLDGPTLARVFQATIKSWNDPAIKALNPGVSLPAIPITLVVPSGPQATTQSFSLFLQEAAGGSWRLGSGPTINWPPAARAEMISLGGAQGIQSTRGAIGYLDEFNTADSSLAVVSVKNRDGDFIAPSSAGATAAAATATLNADLTFTSVWTEGASAYPITYQSWDLVYARQPNPTDAALLKAYLGFLLSPPGQAGLVGLPLAPLPSDIDQAAVAQLSQITG